MDKVMNNAELVKYVVESIIKIFKWDNNTMFLESNQEVTEVCIRKNDILVKNQILYVIKSVALNVIISCLIYFITNNIITFLDIPDILETELIFYMLLIFLSHLILMVLLFVKFEKQLYGYKKAKLIKKLKYSMNLIVLTIAFTIINCLYAYYKSNYLFATLITIVILASILYICIKFKNHDKKDIICKFEVTKRYAKIASKDYNTNYTEGDYITCDEYAMTTKQNYKPCSDIKITVEFKKPLKKKDLVLDVFNSNIHIVENDDILVIWKTDDGIVTITCPEKEIECIKISNQKDVNIVIKYDKKSSKWVQV